MGKGKRLKQQRRQTKGFFDEFSERLAVNFRKEIRNSEIWDQMVAEYGEERATELLQEMDAEVIPGDSSG